MSHDLTGVGSVAWTHPDGRTAKASRSGEGAFPWRVSYLRSGDPPTDLPDFQDVFDSLASARRYLVGRGFVRDDS